MNIGYRIFSVGLTAMMGLTSAFADVPVKYSKAAAKIAKNDACALEAVVAVADLIAEAAKRDGVEIYDGLRVIDIQIVDTREMYGVTFKGSATYIVTTRMDRDRDVCRVVKASKMRSQPEAL